MAAIGDYFFGVIENGVAVWYGNYIPSESDLTPTLYTRSVRSTPKETKRKKSINRGQDAEQK